MDPTLFIATVVAATVGLYTLFAIICFMIWRKFKLHDQENKKINASSSNNISPSSPVTFSSSPTSLSHHRKHQAFPSFHGEDVRKTFLSHLMKELKSKAIDIFIDSDIEKSGSIGPELYKAIRGSRIAIVILSKNYASSSWCLDELVEIIKCREDLHQTVMTLFYDVDPTDVEKQIGDFGKAFKKTCKGKTKENIERWINALAEVAIIAGYPSRDWNSDAAMIEIITTDISNILNNSMPPSDDFDGLVGMEGHMEKLEALLRPDLDEVRMIGIWGRTGIGKTTIARYLYSKHSGSFDACVFMKDIKGFTRPSCSDEHSLKLDLQQQFLSQICHHKDIEISHLGVVQGRLKDKRVFVVLDDVDDPVQLDALAKETQWFGPGSRIIITTQDRRLLKAHGLNYMYRVDYPTYGQALQIICLNAFGQNYPRDGFEELARDATELSGLLPSRIKATGYSFRGMSKQEWKEQIDKAYKSALQTFNTNPEFGNSMTRNSGIRVIYRNAKHKAFSRILSGMKNSRVASAEADDRMRNSRIGIRVRKTKQKIFSSVLSTVKRERRAAVEAARVYQRSKKDTDESTYVE